MMQRSLLLVLAIGLAGCAEDRQPERPAAGSIPHGDYVVEPLLLSAACRGDSHGSSGQLAQRIFYKDRLVTAVALHPTFSPRNPARLLYTVAPPCAKDGTESGTLYYDGVRAAPVRVNPLGMFEAEPGFDAFWSPDDKFVVVLSAEGKMTLANLETGERSDYLSDVFYAKDVFSSRLDFLGWSPDGKSMALTISSMQLIREDRSLLEESVLLSVDPATLRDRYVATMRKGDGWGEGKFTWVAKDGSYDLAVDPSLDHDATVYRKPR